MAQRLGASAALTVLLAVLAVGPVDGSSIAARRVHQTRPVAKMARHSEAASFRGQADDSDWANEARHAAAAVVDADDVPRDSSDEADVAREEDDHVHLDHDVSDDAYAISDASVTDDEQASGEDDGVASSIPNWEHESAKASARQAAEQEYDAPAPAKRTTKHDYLAASDGYLRNADGAVHQFYSCSMACNGCYTDNYQGCLAYCQRGCESYCDVQLPRPGCEQGQIWIAKVGSILSALDKRAVLCQATGVDNCPDGLANEQLPPSSGNRSPSS